MRTANLAIVFTDIKGFTERTSRQTLEQNQHLLRTHHQLLAPVFKAFGGRIVKSIGDAFLVTFESPTQAVLSGMAIQDRLWHHNRTVPPDDRLDVRVAINVGEVRLESNDVFGEPVNIAARVEAIAEAGEVYFTEAVYLAMSKAEVPSQEVGAFELKGIPGKVRVFRVPQAPYRVEAPAPDAPADEQPPFGNLALSRIPESVLAPTTDLASAAAAFGQRAAGLGSRAATVGGQLVERTSTALTQAAARRRLPLTSRHVAVGLGTLALLLGAAFLLRGDSPVEEAIQAVAEAPLSDKGEAVDEARRLIMQERDSAERAWLAGRLDEALEDPTRATGAYRTAARSGHGKAQERLIELLEHVDCGVRSAAADVLADLRLESARGALEELAENGGPGEDPGLPLFGCDSKRAARKALDRLGR